MVEEKVKMVEEEKGKYGFGVNEKKKEKMVVWSVFNNRSYNGYSGSVLKSGICKYFRRGVFDKYEWCVVEMLLFGLYDKGKGLVSNVINRLNILIMEEIVVCEELERVYRLIGLIDKVREVEELGDKIKYVLKFCDISGECKRGRVVSYVNNWWKYNRISMEFKDGEIDMVRKYMKKGDSMELLRMGEKVLEGIKEKDEGKLMSVLGYLYEYEGDSGRRFRRKDGVYIFWEIFSDMVKGNRVLERILGFLLKNFYRKGMKERRYFLVLGGLLVLYGDLNKDFGEISEEYEWDDVVEYMGDREEENVKVNEDYVVKDWHVCKKFGLKRFGEVGSLVIGEDVSMLGGNGEKYREFYIKMKGVEEKRMEEKGEEKKEEKREEKKEEVRVRRKKMKLDDIKCEEIKFSEFEIVKVLEDGVCGLKKCCVVVMYKGEKYVLKEMGKGMNFGIDYYIVDKMKCEYGLEDLGIRLVKSDKGMDRVDKSKRSLVKNWEFVDKKVMYCMMVYKENIGDLVKNKRLLGRDSVFKKMLEIRLFDGLWRSSDNIVRNILVKENGELISIDEGDIFGKREKIFNKGDIVVKNSIRIRKWVDNIIYKFELDKKKKIEKMKGLMEEFGYSEEKIKEMRDRYYNYENIVYNELGY